MPWEKPSAELSARFDAWLPKDARVERRRMFGSPCAFVNGNMFCGLHERNVIVRLPETRRDQLLADESAAHFTVMGRTMREYVALGGALGRDSEEIAALIADAFSYASGLPRKTSKARKPATTRRRTP
jgi:TfoX/Sxy family transcriptional regulator of competence genes